MPYICYKEVVISADKTVDHSGLICGIVPCKNISLWLFMNINNTLIIAYYNVQNIY
jgi:hypothetical protein